MLSHVAHLQTRGASPESFFPPSTRSGTVIDVEPSFDEDFLENCARLRANEDSTAWLLVEGLRTNWHLSRRNRQRNTFGTLSIELPQALDLGLRIALANTFESNAGAFATGHERFDGLFTVHAAAGEVPSVRHLLDGQSCDDFCALAVVGQASLDDHTLSVDLMTLEPATVRRALDLVLHVGTLSEGLAPPASLRSSGVAARVKSFADANGLAMQSNALVVRGAMASARCEIAFRANARPGEPWCEISLRFDEPLGIGLTLRPAGFTDRAREWVGRGDLHLDDEAFDAAWTLHARDDAGARALLHAEARALITTLANAGLVLRVTDEGLDGRVEHAISADAVSTLLLSCERLRDTLRPRSSAGPYRS